MTVWIGQAVLALTNLLDLTVVAKATIILVAGLAALPLANRARAAVRHLLMAATLGTVLLLPLLIGSVPALTVHVPGALAQRIPGLESSSVSTVVVRENTTAMGNNFAGSEYRSRLSLILRLVWATGGIILLVVLVIDLRRVRALMRTGLPWPTRDELVRFLSGSSGVHRFVDVLLHEAVSAPVTCGIWRPTILLPVDADEWQEKDLRRALVHELEHVRRGDWAIQLLARAVCACYWFHPLVWMAWRRLRLEAEHACDDAVLESAESTDYAEQLVTLARRMSSSRSVMSLAMANRTDLSTRVVALLDGNRRRGRVGYGATVSVIGVAAAIVLVVASLNAMAAPVVPAGIVRSPKPIRGDAVTQRAPERTVQLRDVVAAPAAHAMHARGRSQRPKRPVVEDTLALRDSTASVDTTRSFSYRSTGGSSSAQRTAEHSASASASASSSGSSSSETNGRKIRRTKSAGE